MPFRQVFATAVFAGALLCSSVAQSSDGSISFVKPGSRGRSTGMEINPAVVAALQSTTDSVTVSNVPLVTGGEGNFRLEPLQVFGTGAQLVSVNADGTTHVIMAAKSSAWSGSDPNRPGASMFIAANSKNELHAMVLGDARSSVTVIAPDRAADNGSYRIAPNNLPEFPFCAGDLLPPEGQLPTAMATREIRSTTLLDIQLILDISSTLNNSFGGDNEALLDYLVDLIGPINMIYRRDLQADFHVVEVNVFTTDQFYVDTNSNGTIDSSDQLDNYYNYLQANRAPSASDLNHLLEFRPRLGGIAYLGVLQTAYTYSPQYRSGLTNVYAIDKFPTNINTYYWDTMALAHELGHNVGSPHTHCYNPPIDCCFVEGGVDCSGCTTAAPAAGTIMSYCHLQFANGGSILMQFHARCIALMRPLLESSPLLSPHVSTSDLQVRGVHDFVMTQFAPTKANTLRSASVGGPVVTQTFTIESTGDVPLQLLGTPRVSISGSSHLSIVSQPAATLLQPGEKTSFVVQYNPAVGGQVTATVSIPTNRATASIYKMIVAGQVVQVSAPVSVSFNGTRAIAESFGWTDFPLQVTGIPGWVSDVNLRFNGTNCAIGSQTGIEHPAVGDLGVDLLSPEGTQIQIMNSPGSGPYGSIGANFCNTLFDDAAAQTIESITAAQAPYSGSFKPNSPLSTFNGERPNGTWTVRIRDVWSPDTGSAHSISLIVSGEIVANVTDWSVY